MASAMGLRKMLLAKLLVVAVFITRVVARP